jgi:hypothetical protein
LPLGEHDIRRTKKKTELVLQICRTFVTTSGPKIMDYAPFRDGAHAKWDSTALGGVPVYVIDTTGAAHLQAPDLAA